MTIIDTALHEHLRALKLSGMRETLDARLSQARAGELGHLEFLQVLCHDEITRRETVGMQRRLRRARFEQQHTLEEFDYQASPKLPAAAIRDRGVSDQMNQVRVEIPNRGGSMGNLAGVVGGWQLWRRGRVPARRGGPRGWRRRGRGVHPRE